MLNKYPGLFSDGVGTFAGPKVRIYISADTQPLFHKARPVPYMIECELDHLQREGIISTVEYTDWAAPIVPILKADGTAHLWGLQNDDQPQFKAGWLPFAQSRGSVHHSHGWPDIQ